MKADHGTTAVALIAAISIAALLVDTEWRQCHRIEAAPSETSRTAMYYWLSNHSKANRGICAVMYTPSGEEEGQIWEVERPHPGEPTALYMFNSQDDAETYVERFCPTRDKNWQVVK